MSYRALAILLALVILGVASPGARAEESPTKLTIAPVDADGSYFTLELEPGATEVLTVELANKGEDALEVKSYSADVYSLINGGFGVRLVDEPRTGTSHWIDYTLDDFTLDAGEAMLHTFVVEVPEDATPGDYLTSVVIQTADPVEISNGDSNVGLNQILRQAIAIAIDVPGPREPLLAIDGITHTSNLSRSTVRIGVANPGNQHLKPLAQASIETAEGALVHEQEIEMASVYAGTETAVEMIFSPALEPGDYFAALDLADEETGTTASAQRLPFTVEAPPEPELVEESTIGRIANDPRMPGGGGTGSLIWLIGMIAATAGLAALVGVAMGRRRSGPTASASVVVTEAQEHARPRAEAPTALRKAHTSPQIRPLLPPKSAR